MTNKLHEKRNKAKKWQVALRRLQDVWDILVKKMGKN